MTVRSSASKFEWHDWPQSRQDYDATAHISYVLSRLLVIDRECMSSIAKRCIELPMLHHQPFLLQVGIGIPMLALLSTRITVIGTGLVGWLLSIVMILCSGPLWVNSYTSISVSRLTEFDRKGESTGALWFCFPPGMLWEIKYRYDLAGLGHGGSNRQDWCSNSVGRWHILSPVRTRLLSLLEGSCLYDSLLCRTDGTSGDF